MTEFLSRITMPSQAGLVTVRRHQRQMVYAIDFGAMRRFMDFLQKDCCQDHPDICGCAPAEPAHEAG